MYSLNWLKATVKSINVIVLKIPLGGSLQQVNLITVKTKYYYKQKFLHVKNQVESVSLQVGMPRDDLGQTHCNLIEKYMIIVTSVNIRLFDL